MNRSSSNYLTYLFVAAILCIGLYVLPGRLVGSEWDRVPGDFGDSRLNNFFLEHGFQYFTGKVGSYWDAPFMYPDAKTLSYSDNLLGSLPIYILWRVLGVDRETSFQLWFIALCVLNFLAAFYCFHKLKFNGYLSGIGAYIFAFSLPFAGHLGHAQMIAQFCIPFVFYHLVQFFQSRSVFHFFYSFIFLAWQFYCGMYLGFLTLLLVIVMAFLFMIFYPRFWVGIPNKPRFLFQLLVVFVIFLVILLPIGIPYYMRASISGYKNYSEVIPLLLSFRNYLMPPGESWLWKSLQFFNTDVPMFWEKQMWAGGMLFFSFCLYLTYRIVGIVKGKGTHLILFLSILVSSLLLVHWGGGFSFFKYIRWVPGFSSLKPVGRIILPQIFLMSWILLLLIRAVTIKYALKPWVFGIVAAMAIVDHGVSDSMLLQKTYSKKESQERINSIVQKASNAMNTANEAYTAIAYMPAEIRNPVEIQIEGALAAQQIGIPSINGYSSTCNGAFGLFWEHYDSASLVKWLDHYKLDIVKDRILIIQ